MVDNKNTPGAKIQGLWRLFRFELPLTAGVCVILGELLALGRFPSVRAALLGFLSVFLISAAALILNDYFDLESDKINAPHRPLPSGLVTGQEVVMLTAGVTVLGLLTSYLLSLEALLLASLVWVVGFLYNWRFKRAGFWGNLLVSFSVGMTFIFGGIAAGAPFERVVWLFASLSFLVNLGEEIAADAMDVAGDRVAGSRSLAVLYGSEAALKVSAALFLLVIVVSGLPFLLGWLDWLYALPLGLMNLVILYSTVKLLDARQANRRKYIRYIYLSGLLAFTVFIAIRLATSL